MLDHPGTKKKIDDSSLKKAGGFNQSSKGSAWGDWQNTGPIFGGGYHVAFTNQTLATNPLVVPGHENQDLGMVGPGPRLLFNPKSGIMYGFTPEGTMLMINDSGDPNEMSKNLQKCDKYGEGPVLMTRMDSLPGHSATIGFVSGLGGKGWMPVEVNNAAQYMSSFGGMNKLGLTSGAWKGQDDKLGLLKGNMAADPFMNDGKPFSTKDDTASRIGQMFIGVGFDIILQGLKMAGEGIVDIASGGASAIAFAALDPLIDKGLDVISKEATKEFTAATGIDKYGMDYQEKDMNYAVAQNQLKDLPGFGEQAKNNYSMYDDMFSHAVKIDNIPGDFDSNFLPDPRVEIVKKQHEQLTNQLNDKITEMEKTDPKLSAAANDRKIKGAAMVRERLALRSEELKLPEQLRNEKRDRNLDGFHYNELLDTNAKIEYALTSINGAQKAEVTKLKIRAAHFHPSVDEREKQYFYVFKHILPEENTPRTGWNEQLRKQQRIAAEMSTRFQKSFEEKHEKSHKIYEDLIDTKLELTGHRGEMMMENILTKADFDEFQELVEYGIAEPDELPQYRQDKMRAYLEQKSGKPVITSKVFDLLPQYKKFTLPKYKSDKKSRFGRFFPELSDEEFTEMDKMYKKVDDDFKNVYLRKIYYPSLKPKVDEAYEKWKKQYTGLNPPLIPLDFTDEQKQKAADLMNQRTKEQTKLMPHLASWTQGYKLRKGENPYEGMEDMTNTERVEAIEFMNAYTSTKNYTQNLTDWEQQMRDSRGKGGISMDKLNTVEKKQAATFAEAYKDLHRKN